MAYRYTLEDAKTDSEKGVHWKMWLFNYVDDYRRHPGIGSIPDLELKWGDIRTTALVHSVCAALLDESGFPEEEWPEWLLTHRFLPEPWFVAGYDSLMATAILESPVWFRRNSIYVMGNFLNRV